MTESLPDPPVEYAASNPRRRGGPRRRGWTDWLAYVETAEVPPWVRRVLLAYAHRGHRGARTFSRPLAEVMAELGMSKTAVLKALRLARKAGLLVVVERGIQGRTAVYEGTFGTPISMGELGEPISQNVDGSRGVHPNDSNGFSGSPHYYANDDASPNQSRRAMLLDSLFAVQEGRDDFPSLSPAKDGGRCLICRGATDVDDMSVCADCAAVVSAEYDALAEREEEVG